MCDKRLQILETEIAYLRKAIEELLKARIVEIHYHYYYDYDKIKDILNKYTDNNETH